MLHTHEFRILRLCRPNVRYVHRVDERFCRTHACAAPTDCGCEPLVFESPEESTALEFVYHVLHQAKELQCTNYQSGCA